jgi:hypothetical protein
MNSPATAQLLAHLAVLGTRAVEEAASARRQASGFAPSARTAQLQRDIARGWETEAQAKEAFVVALRAVYGSVRGGAAPELALQGLVAPANSLLNGMVRRALELAAAASATK